MGAAWGSLPPPPRLDSTHSPDSSHQPRPSPNSSLSSGDPSSFPPTTLLSFSLLRVYHSCLLPFLNPFAMASPHTPIASPPGPE